MGAQSDQGSHHVRYSARTRWSRFSTDVCAVLCCAGQQVDRRIRLLCRWPFMWMHTRAGRWRNDAVSTAARVYFSSSVWQVRIVPVLVLADVC